MHPIPSIILTTGLAIHANRGKSLTRAGIFAAIGTAIVHAAHPSGTAFALLVAFFLMGSRATKYKHALKAAKVTSIPISNPSSSSSSSSAESKSTTAPPRTHVQVFANSLGASILLAISTYFLYTSGEAAPFTHSYCLPILSPSSHSSSIPHILFFGTVIHYAAVTADTLSSELGILSTSSPRLVTRPWQRVPPGTNGGVTVFGLVAGFLGAAVIGSITLIGSVRNPCAIEGSTAPLLSSGDTTVVAIGRQVLFVLVVALLGLAGSLIDSLIGALAQETRVGLDGKVLEVEGGEKLTKEMMARLTEKEKDEGTVDSVVRKNEDERIKIVAGLDIFSNNTVNILMASLTTVLGMALFVAFYGLT